MCGIIGVYSLKDKTKNIYPLVVKGLLDLQHRGQLSAGVTSYNPERKRILQTHKKNGKVHDVFEISHRFKSKRLLEDYSGRAAIGHTRYATSGNNEDSLAQPFERPHGRKSKWFSLAFNGNLANVDKLKAGLEDVGYNMTYDSDTEVIMHFLSREVQSHKPGEDLNFVDIFKNLLKDFDGSWNIAFLNADGKMVAVRDPLGLKPMCYGVTDDGILVFASESVVLSNLQIEATDLKPGEMIIADGEDFTVKSYIDKEVDLQYSSNSVYYSGPSKLIETHMSNPKENLIVFPHRIAPEKQPEIFKDLAQSIPEYKFIICQEKQLTKAEYHAIIRRAKIIFSANLQETLGISPYEGALVGAIPMVPDRLSYSEMYSADFKYNSTWTLNFDNYLKHKEKLINLIKHRMDNYTSFYPSVVEEADKLSEEYFSCTPLLQKLNT